MRMIVGASAFGVGAWVVAPSPAVSVLSDDEYTFVQKDIILA